MLPNVNGTAPGFAVQIGESTAFFLPGVPREMKRMFTEQVLPRVRPAAPNNTFQVRLRTYGMGESAIGQALEGIEAAHPGVLLGYRVHFPEVDVKVHARGRVAGARARRGPARGGGGEGAARRRALRRGRRVVRRGRRPRRARPRLPPRPRRVVHRRPHRPPAHQLPGERLPRRRRRDLRQQRQEPPPRRLGGHAPRPRRRLGRGGGRDGRGRAPPLRVRRGPRASPASPGRRAARRASPSGSCYWAVAHPGGTVVREHVFTGDRDEVQLAAAYAGLDLLRRVAAGLPER